MIRPNALLMLLLALVLCPAPAGRAFDPAQQDDSQALVRHFAVPLDGKRPPAFAGGLFKPFKGETITLMGGADMEELAESGYFEARLHRAFADDRLKVRSVAWPADTAYRQQRPMFFFTAEGDTREGSVPDLRERIVPGTFIMQFGKMESLDGWDALPAFSSALDDLLTALEHHTPRLVLVGPTPFFSSGPAAELADGRNMVLAMYNTAVRDLAGEHGAIFIDLLASIDASRSELSRDGILLSDEGRREVARLLAEGLRAGGGDTNADPELLSKVRDKNLLWQQYFRPTNWAFLFGDRQHVPSSRDHIDAKRRWFVEELDRLPPLIEEAEGEIWRAAAP